MNVVVMAYLFNVGMLDCDYTFGKVEIHQAVLDELESWRSSREKIRKFGAEVISTLITKCQTLLSDLPSLTQTEQDKYFRRISRVESSIPNNQKGMETSKFDKGYLALAAKHNGILATQEKTLRQLAPHILENPTDLSSFEDMLLDAYTAGHLSRQNVIDGLNNLAYYDEQLRKGELARIKQVVSIP